MPLLKVQELQPRILQSTKMVPFISDSQ